MNRQSPPPAFLFLKINNVKEPGDHELTLCRPANHQGDQPTKSSASDFAGSELSSFPIKGTLSRTTVKALVLPGPRLGVAGYISGKWGRQARFSMFSIFFKNPGNPALIGAIFADPGTAGRKFGQKILFSSAFCTRQAQARPPAAPLRVA